MPGPATAPMVATRAQTGPVAVVPTAPMGTVARTMLHTVFWLMATADCPFANVKSSMTMVGAILGTDSRDFYTCSSYLAHIDSRQQGTLGAPLTPVTFLCFPDATVGDPILSIPGYNGSQSVNILGLDWLTPTPVVPYPTLGLLQAYMTTNKGLALADAFEGVWMALGFAEEWAKAWIRLSVMLPVTRTWEQTVSTGDVVSPAVLPVPNDLASLLTLPNGSYIRGAFGYPLSIPGVGVYGTVPPAMAWAQRLGPADHLALPWMSSGMLSGTDGLSKIRLGTNSVRPDFPLLMDQIMAGAAACGKAWLDYIEGMGPLATADPSALANSFNMRFSSTTNAAGAADAALAMLANASCEEAFAALVPILNYDPLYAPSPNEYAAYTGVDFTVLRGMKFRKVHPALPPAVDAALMVPNFSIAGAEDVRWWTSEYLTVAAGGYVDTMLPNDIESYRRTSRSATIARWWLTSMPPDDQNTLAPFVAASGALTAAAFLASSIHGVMQMDIDAWIFSQDLTNQQSRRWTALTLIYSWSPNTMPARIYPCIRGRNMYTAIAGRGLWNGQFMLADMAQATNAGDILFPQAPLGQITQQTSALLSKRRNPLVREISTTQPEGVAEPTSAATP